MPGFFMMIDSNHKRFLLLIAVLTITAAIYSIGLNGPFVFDDADNLRPLNRWLSGELSWRRVVFDNSSGRLGRPISMASFVLNVWLFGPEIWGFKLGNLIIHVINGLLVYLFFSKLLQLGALNRKAPAGVQWLPLLGTALWLLHPLFVSTVLYVVQRMAMLSAMFMLLTMLSYLHGRIALESGRWRRAWPLLLIAVPACTVLATLSKENGVLALPLCALLEWFVFAPPAGKARPWASRLVLLFGLFLPAVAAITLTLAESPQIVGEYANRPFTLEQRLMTQGRVLWSYVGSLLLPFGPRLGLYHDDFLLSRSMFDPATTIMAWAAWLVVIGLSYRMRRSIPGLALGVGIFLVGHALESSVFPLLMYFEHRNYLPAVGAIWAFLGLGSALATKLKPHLHQGPRLAAYASIGLVCTLAVATTARAYVWQSRQALLAQGLAHHPDSKWLRIDLAQDAMLRVPPDHTEARRHIDALLTSNEPSTRRMAGAWQLLADCGTGGRAAPESLETAFGGDMDILEADLLITFESLGSNIMRTPCPGLGPNELGNALVSMLDRSSMAADHFNFRRLRFKASQLLLAAERPTDALEQARLAYSGSPADAPIGVFLAELEILAGSREQAVELVEKLSTQIPRDDITGKRLLDGLNQLLQDALPENHAGDVAPAEVR